MSLKEFTKEIFTRYGLTEEDINVYLGYLRVPRATSSLVYIHLAEEHDIDQAKVDEITAKLVKAGFLKEIDGIIKRYIPLEPFFELFTSESEKFRAEIAKIKDAVLADQSSRFEKLEEIQDKSISEVEKAVSDQTNAFFEDSDAKNVSKKERIENAKNRFTETSKTLEKELHDIIEEDYTRTQDDINKLDKDTADLWDSNSSKFTNDNEVLNNELSEITKTQVDGSKNQEKNIHTIMDTLNSDLSSISSSFVNDNESGINTAKDNITNLIANLLEDFSKRVDNLEKELKKDLDGHVDRHKNIANELRPKMEQILEKYLERMNKVISDLKDKISKLLNEHTSHIKDTSESIKSNLNAKVDNRHNELCNLINNYKDKAITLLENLLESANRFSDFAEDMANQGLFFFGGKKKKYKARWAQVEEDVASLSRPFKENWITECEDFIANTRKTSDNLQGEVTEIMGKENQSLNAETKALDTKAQETINAELETLATDMASEIDNTLQGGIKDCSDTSIKLKDLLENTLKQHRTQYDEAINRHRDDTLRHYDDFDKEIKRKNETWVKDVDSKFLGGKRDITTEIETQIRTINEHLDKTKNKNIEHSKTFQNDVAEVKSKQRKLYDDLLAKVRSDFDKSKSNTSEKINNEIKLWDEESADMDKMLTDMLEDHKNKYKENATSLQTSLSNTTRDTVQNVKDAIADFTLQFMNSIDDATELAEENEEKLKDIHKASSSIPEISKVTTWHTVGRAALISAIKDAILRTKSSVIVVTPTVIPEVLQLVSEFAYQKRAVRFMLTSHWDMQTYGNIIQKMQQLGNIQFRQLSTAGEYYAITRDAEEVIIAPNTKEESEMIAIVSTQAQYSKLYSQFIGPIFQANSRPIK
ncbi:MAG: hypothetical protein ACTSQJ_05690 [Promethearchaeota archaeon]